MFAPRDYLLVEWANIERTLSETLRYRYTERDTAEFHEECGSRLKFVKRLLESVDPTDLDALTEIAIKLHELSDLIAYVERSHLEEFSWPFAYALRRIATDVCKERSLVKRANIDAPLFFFTAEGGMCSYAVRSEYPAPGLVGKKIFTVVFPRTLKDSVLLHTIIGHEIGHAAISTLTVRNELRRIVETLVRDSVVADPNQLFDWCKNNLGITESASTNYLEEQAESWAEEFYCDLFGLLTMGPCFLPAFQALLAPTSRFPLGQFVPSHPPFESRLVTLMHAARAMGMLYSETAAAGLKGLTPAIDSSFVQAATLYSGTPLEILRKENIEAAATDLVSFGSKFGVLNFPDPEATLIQEMVAALGKLVPPVGRYPAVVSGPDNKPVPQQIERVDFRHILLAGWVRCSQLSPSNGKSFRHVNSLCSHAILQQEGISYWVERRKNEATAPK